MLHRLGVSSSASLLRRGLAATLVVGAQAASAMVAIPPPDLDIELSYSIASPYAISNVITFNSYANPGIGSWWPASLPAGGGTIVDPFAKSSGNAPLTGLMLGLTGPLAGDDPLTTHVVMMVSPGAGAAMQGTSFTALFPNTTESTLASQIQFVTGVTRDPDGTGNAADWDAALTGLYAFATGDALSLSGIGGSSIWFGLGAVVPGATTTSGLSVLAFSSGQTIGFGAAALATAVPEPQTWALWALGLGVLGAAARRRAH